MAASVVNDEFVRAIANYDVASPKDNTKGGLSAFINAKAGSMTPVVFQTSDVESQVRCIAPFGISKPKPGMGENGKLNLEVTLANPVLEQYVSSLDAFVLEKASSNAGKWFPTSKNLTPEYIKMMYKPCLGGGNYPKGADKLPIPGSTPYSHTFRVKVVTQGRNPTKIFTATRTPQGGYSMAEFAGGNIYDSIPKYSQVVLVVSVSGVWFMSKEFGVGFNALQILVFPPESGRNVGFDFGGAPVQMVQSVPSMLCASISSAPTSDVTDENFHAHDHDTSGMMTD